MFSVRLINADSYQALPSPQLDPTFSEFRGSEIKYVPIIRIFGTTPTGKKTCLHLHGAFPYMYVPYTSEKKDDNLLYKLAASLDAAINISLGTATSKTQHVYKIQVVTGIPLYGYHKEQHQFLKILFYNPMIIKKAASLLQNGSVMNQSLQPHEAHIPYVLQFMIDYNVHGMSWINLSTIKFRQASQSQTENGKVLNAFNCLSDSEYSTTTIECQSTCQLEADAFVSDILNRQEVEKNVDLNPGLAAIWNEEKARRFQNKFHGCDSQLVYPKSPKRPTYRMTIDDLYQERRFNQRLETISLSDKSKISKNEIWHPFQIENMEELPSSSTVEKPKIILNQCSNRSLLDCSVLDSADQPLVEMLDDLAQDDLVDNDSILGLRINSHNTQDDFEYDIKEEKEMEDAEHEANDLTLTCMQLESLSSWSTIKPLFDDHSQNKTMMVNEPLMEKLPVNNSDSGEVEFTIPQLDGIGDLLVNGFGSETSENLQVSKRVGQLNEKSFGDTRDINNRKCLNSIKSVNYSEFLRNSDRSWPSASTNVHFLRAVVFNKCKSYYKNITPEINNKNIYEHKSDQHQFNSKDILRLSTTKNLNYNFNTVATSEKLQSVKFISIEIAKNKRFNKLRRNNIFINRPFDDSIIRKRRKTLGNRLSNQTHQNNWPKIKDINRKFVKFIYSESMKNTFLHIFRNISITFKCLSPNDNYRSPQANEDNAYNNISNSYNDNITRTDTKLLAFNRYDQMLKLILCSEDKKTDELSIQTKKLHACLSIHELNFDDQDKTIQIDTYEKKSYLNNIYDYRGDSKCLLKVSSDLTDSDKLCKKISQESFFISNRLDPLEPRFSGWNPKITRTAFTQLQKPKVMLQRLSPATRKHYGYNQPLESKIFQNNFSIPSLDGSADFTSSDSEPDTDTSVVKTEEKRVCAYISENNKRKHKEIDNKADQCIPINQTAQFSTSLRQLPKNYSSLEIFIEPKEASTNKSFTPQHKRQKILTRSTQNEGLFIKNESLLTAQTTSDMISESRSISDLLCNLENKPEVIQTNQGNDKNIGSISNLMDISSMQLLNNHYDKSECTATLTEHLESKITESFFLKRSYVICDSVKKSVIIIPNTNPPKLHDIIATLKLYDFSKRQKKLAQQMLKVNSKNIINVPVFKSRLKSLTGINLWRKLKLQDFYSLNKKNKFILNAPTIITPLLFPPLRKKVINLMTARKNDESNKIITSKIFNSTSSEHNNPLFEKKTRINVQPKRKIIGKYNKPLKNSFKKKLKVSSLLKQNKTSNRIGFSCGQIEYQSDSTRSNITNENLNNAKTLVAYDYLTILCIEIHANTRGDLLPDPQSDSINAIFYAIKKNIPPGPDVKPLEHGVIVVISKGQYEFDYDLQSNKHFAINHVSSEIELFERLIELISRTDPEIFIGWEIEFLSWGYLFQRAAKLDLNLAKSISRIPNVQSKWESNVLAASESLQETKLPGRIVLDIWRIMRSEISLLTYTFENVMYHVLNERLPCPSFKALTSWWELQQPKTRWKVIQHYCIKVVGILRIIEQLDIIGRTSEHARLFGIQFYEVFSRGSQYRVESIMLRLAKPLNYIPVSPSAHQRASMRAMEALPLIMEPESMFYTDPLIVLDFQSLYPSIIIAYNICFSTCLGRIEHIGQSDPFEFGASVLRVSKNTALELKGKVNFTPCGVAFVKPEVRVGILPRMLTEILDTRFMVKKAMKDYAQNNKTLHRVLHSRQHGLKYLANVTYGYTAANFSGRMPCIEVGDSVISKAKETLERAIKLVESTTKWGARVVYGDTDSLFILIPGKSKKDAFAIGNEIADAVTLDNPSPIKLKFEKILFPSILQTKKRYCGYMYEQPDQISPKFLAKGIETVRRDGCPAVSKILEKTLKILFDSKDLSQVKHYITRQIDKILRGKVSLDDLTFAKEFRGLRGYKEKACVPALELTRRLMKKDPLALPRRGERVRYVIVCGAPNQALIHCVRTPWEVLNDPGLRLNVFYYITRVIIPPLNRCLNLMGVEVNNWLQEMPHRQILDNPTILPSDKQKHTIFQYFGNIVCIICESLTNKGICFDCVTKPTDTLIILNEKVRWLDRINDHINGMCQSCFGRTNDIDCSSLDCPVLYRRVRAENDFRQANELIKFIEDGSTFKN
ncbi:hypothetical protein HCN44_000377 [Aphidius gifuensis]|uniref:DNA polymerase zeta catalytic subunit n=1 Tax=Aphidius gifuensis TaxID=684658 RepID=A0A835CNS5_APHGI|nr:hypothetical protein HCN44_000377 [Aphidius gifuensis]